MAEESAQPVPCVWRVSTRTPEKIFSAPSREQHVDGSAVEMAALDQRRLRAGLHKRSRLRLHVLDALRLRSSG